MATENKQTLFEFRTLRAPQLIDDADKYNYFARIQNPELSYFILAMDDIPGATTKKAYLATKATDYVSEVGEYLTLESVKATEFYELAIYLLANRNTLTHTDLAANVGALSSYTDEEIVAIWDALFYQIITSESLVVREALLLAVLGTHVYTLSASATTDEKAQKLASSVIVLPPELFSADHDYENAVTNPQATSGAYVFDQHLQVAEANLQVAYLQQTLAEVQTYRADYHRVQTLAEAAALKSHNTAVEAFVKSMAIDPTIDPEDAPVYSYSKPAEISDEAFEENLSDKAYDIISEGGFLKCKSFNDLEKELSERIRNYQDEAFRSTGFFHEKQAIDGTVLPKGCNTARSNTPFSFALKAVPNGSKFDLLLVVDVGSSCLKLEEATVNSSDPLFGLTTKKGGNKDGIVTINLTETGAVSISEDTINVSIWLRFNNGLQLQFPGDETLSLFSVMYYAFTPVSPESTHSRIFAPSGHGITRLGIADYHKVEQALCCYVPGEVSHIENIMAREYKERSTRRLSRLEDTSTTSKSRESERQTDTTTTTRFELQREISEVLTENMERSSDVNSSSNLGVSKGLSNSNSVNFDTSFDVSSNFANSTSQENSTTESVNFAKEVTQKALDRVVSKVSEERVIKMIEEFEEQNRHGFDNRQGAEHISGVYRWVDKVYKNTLRTYRNRTIYEFMIPEPASFHMMAKTAAGVAAESFPVREPMDPRTQSFGLLAPITHAAMINESNYQQWAAVYGAEVAPPPDVNIVIGKTISSTLDPEQWNKSQAIADEIRLPEGYGVNRAFVNCLGQVEKATPGNWARFYATVAGIPRIYWAGSSNWHERHLQADIATNPELSRFTESVPVGAQFTGVEGGMISFELELVRKPSHFAQWQLDTYNLIIEAYEERLKDYRDALAEVEIKRKELLADNPAYFRQIEKTVLKKNCIAYMIGHLNMGKNFLSGNTPGSNHVIQNANLDKYAAVTKFFEQAFEWSIMDYTFYPFYWGNRQNWEKLYGLDSTDALFRSFLQSGMARVHVTVRPGFENAVMLYFATGQVWSGGEAPILDDDLYMSVVGELTDPEFTVSETWETRVPSTLTVIQAKTIALDAEGLPCYCDEEEPPVEAITSVEPLATLEVFIPGSEGTTGA